MGGRGQEGAGRVERRDANEGKQGRREEDKETARKGHPSKAKTLAKKP